MSELAAAIAMTMGLSGERVVGLRIAAAVHDIGKLFIPAETLSTPRPLTNIERKIIMLHRQSGADILTDIAHPSAIGRIILEHHERLYGPGYPQGLRGEDILLETGIIAVADVVEAMSSHRPYRPARDVAEALKEITDNSRCFYDPAVVAVCLSLITHGEFQFA